jgi:hypothetical protein
VPKLPSPKRSDKKSRRTPRVRATLKPKTSPKKRNKVVEATPIPLAGEEVHAGPAKTAWPTIPGTPLSRCCYCGRRLKAHPVVVEGGWKSHFACHRWGPTEAIAAKLAGAAVAE